MDYLTTKAVKIGISTEIITYLCHPSYITAEDSAKKVTHPMEETSNPLKATSDERCPEQELRKSQEEPRVPHDNHSTNATRARMDECINENYNQQQAVRATSATRHKDRVMCDKTNVVHYSTLSKKNHGVCKHKDTIAKGTSYKRQDDLTTIVWPLESCSPRKQKTSPSKKRSAGITKPIYDPLSARVRRAAELRTKYADQRKAQQLNLVPSGIPQGYNEDSDSI
jgi:hypothetical protein